MVNYVYEVSWNECDEKDTFPTFPEAKDFINQKTATGNPNYVSPFIYEIELAEDENGMFVPTGNDVCVFSWDNQTGQPDIRQPKLFDDSEYEDADFEIYDVFDTEKEPEPAEPEVDPYDGRNLFNFDEALSALNEADEAFGECQCCHEEFPKEELVKEGSRFVCKKCAGNLTEALKIISDISEYKPWSGAVATWDKIEAANKVDDLEALLEDAYPDGLTMTELNDILWFDPEWILEALGLDADVEESLEDTVPEDLADDRTPKQGNVFKLEQPVDYKKEIAKEKLVDEELHEDVELTEAIFDRHKEVAKICDDKGKEANKTYAVYDRLNKKVLEYVAELDDAINKCKGTYGENITAIVLVKNNTAANIESNVILAEYRQGKETKNNFKTVLAKLQAARKVTNSGPVELNSEEETPKETPKEEPKEEPKEDPKEEQKEEEKPAEDAGKERSLSAATAKEVYNEIKTKLEAEGLLDKEKAGPKLVGDIKRGLTFLGKAFTAAVKEGASAEESLETPAENILVEDLDQDLAKWNEYVKFLQEQIALEEKALEEAKDNELVKKAIQRKIDLYKEDLEEALPNLVKDSDAEIESISEDELEAVEEDLDAAVNESVAVEVKQPLKESYNEDEFKRYMAAAEKLGIKTGADMIKFSEEHGGVKDKALLDAMEAEANKQE